MPAEANAGSRWYGVYSTDTHAQVARGRLVTDEATFGRQRDVIGAPALRGRSAGRLLLSSVVALRLKRTLPATEDAHGVYAQSVGLGEPGMVDGVSG